MAFNLIGTVEDAKQSRAEAAAAADAKKAAAPVVPTRLMPGRGEIPQMYRWLFSIKALGSQDDKNHTPAPRSHLSLDGYGGGQFYVPASHSAEFLDRYAEAVGSGHPMFVVECRTEVFQMHGDMDITRYVPGLDNTLLLQYARTWQRVVKRFYPNKRDLPANTFETLLCVTPSQQTGLDPPKWKYAVHPIMPHLGVTAQQALTMREAQLVAFRKEYGDMEGVQNSWDDVLDVAVYMANGLRMVGSRKTILCPTCKNSKKRVAECMQCMGKGRLDAGRVYNLWAVLDSEGQYDATRTSQLQMNYTRLIHACSIRRQQPATPGFARFKGCPAAPLAAKANQVVVLDRESGKVVSFREDEMGRRALRCQDLRQGVLSQKRYTLAQEAIRKYHPRYRHVDVHTIATNKAETRFFVTLRGEGSSFCQNKGSDHNHNTAYFVISQNGLSQKCFCRCHVERMFGTCSEYESNPVALSRTTQAAFFSGMKELGALEARRTLTLSKTNASLMVQQVESIMVRLIGDLTESEVKQRERAQGGGRGALRPGTTGRQRPLPPVRPGDNQRAGLDLIRDHARAWLMSTQNAPRKKRSSKKRARKAKAKKPSSSGSDSSDGEGSASSSDNSDRPPRRRRRRRK